MAGLGASSHGPLARAVAVVVGLAVTAAVAGVGAPSGAANAGPSTIWGVPSLVAELRATEGGLDAAAVAVSSHRAAVAEHLVPLLDQSARNIETAREIVAAGEAASDPLALAGAVAELATTWQLDALGIDPAVAAAGVVTPDHDRPSTAARALVEAEGFSVTSEQADDIANLDALPEPAAAALTDVIDAFSAFSAATKEAYADVDIAHVRSVLEDPEARLDPAAVAAGPGVVLASLGLDLGPVLVARGALTDAAIALSRALDDSSQSQLVLAPVAVAPVFSIEVLGANTYYSQDFLLLIDQTGHDTYDNNGGGSGIGYPIVGAWPGGAAALIDLSGTDAYRGSWWHRSRGVNGGADIGSGFLFDAAGNDTYSANDAAINGGGWFGAGFLLDVAGDDTFRGGQSGINGGSLAGAGTLLDLAGSNRFEAGSIAVNGGTDAGVGFLVGGVGAPGGPVGTDVYASGNDYTNGSGVLGGRGFLMDADGGADRYTAGNFGVNGSGQTGSGFLYDSAGDDQYSGGSTAVNGGGNLGVGLLIDDAGDDQYTAADWATNGGGDLGVGTIIDSAGNDTYRATDTGTNGGGVLGAGLLYDRAGNDVYEAGHSGVNGGGLAGTGLLYDGAGVDTYTDSEVDYLGTGDGNGTDQSAVPKGLAGAQVDYPVSTPPTTLPTVTTTSIPLPTTTSVVLPTTTTSSIVVPTTTTTSIVVPTTTTTVPSTTSTTVPPTTTTTQPPPTTTTVPPTTTSAPTTTTTTPGPFPPPVVRVGTDATGCTLKFVDTPQFGIWHAPPGTPSTTVCLVVKTPVATVLRVTVDAGAI